MHICKSNGKIITDKSIGCKGCSNNIVISDDSERYVTKKLFDEKWNIWDNYKQHFIHINGFKRKKDVLNKIDEMKARELASNL